MPSTTKHSFICIIFYILFCLVLISTKVHWKDLIVAIL